MRLSTDHIFPIKLSLATRIQAVCYSCQQSLGETGYGSSKSKGLYCSEQCAIGAELRPELRVPVEYRQEFKSG